MGLRQNNGTGHTGEAFDNKQYHGRQEEHRTAGKTTQPDKVERERCGIPKTLEMTVVLGHDISRLFLRNTVPGYT